MIFVTVGTHEDPFDRLVQAAELLAAGGAHVRLQKGPSSVPTPSCDGAAWFTPDQMAEAFAAAEVVVCHGGPSTIVEAGCYGHLAVVVPRQARYGEHVDDHQLRFARRIAGRVHLVEDIEALPDAIVAHADWREGRHPLGADPARTQAFAKDLEALCQRVSQTPRAPRRLRDRLRALQQWAKNRR